MKKMKLLPLLAVLLVTLCAPVRAAGAYDCYGRAYQCVGAYDCCRQAAACNGNAGQVWIWRDGKVNFL